MAFKKIDVTASIVSIEIEFFDQWATKLSKLDIKTLDNTILPITRIIKAKSGKGFSLVVENHCLIWVWSNSKFGEAIKQYIAIPTGRPAIIPLLNKSPKDFEFGIDEEIICKLHSLVENTWIIEPITPKLP